MEPGPRPRPRGKDALLLVAVLLATAALYAPFLDHPFHYDSVVKIVGNRKLQDPLQYLRAFGRSGYSEDTTRLIPNLTLSLDRALFGQDPFGFHLTSLLVHLLNVCLLYLLGRFAWARLQGANSSAPLLGATIFALHPLNSEAVNYCNALPNLMLTAFYLLALIALLRATGSPAASTGARIGRWAAFWLSLFCALLSKELAVTVVVMAPLLLLWNAGREADRPWLLSGRRLLLFGSLPLLGIASLAATGAFNEVRRAVFGAGDTLTGSWPLTLLLTVLGQAQILPAYLLLALVPWPGLLNVDHGRHLHLYRRLFTRGDAGIEVHYQELVIPVISLLILAAVVAVVVRRRRRAPFLTFFCLWPLVTHAPTSLVPRGEPMVEYRTYLPMVGVCLALAWGLERALNAAARSLPHLSLPFLRSAAALALAAALASGTAVRNTAWTTELSLWQDSAQKAPKNHRAHTNLGKALAARGRIEEAARHYRRALELNPRYIQALNNLGNLLARRGRTREAIELYERALAVDPGFVEVLNNLGKALADDGRPDEAEKHYRRALEIKPYFAEAHSNLGAAMEARNRPREGIAHYRRALELAPDLVPARNNLGNAYLRRGQFAQAIEQYRRAIAIDPRFAEAHGNLGRALALRNDSEQAISSLRRALEIEPDQADVRNNLGNVLARQGKLGQAAAEFRSALRLEPGMADAHNNLGNILSFQGELEKAAEHYRLALKANPRLAEAENNLGRLLQLQDRTSEAIEHYRRAIELAPDSAEAHHNLGGALSSLGRSDEAVAHLRRALELKPDYAKASEALRRALEMSGETE
jgi:tetratricopeptide (TPR) repeat protein